MSEDFVNHQIENGRTHDENMDLYTTPYKEKLITFTPVALKCISKKASAQNREKFTKIGSDYNMCFKLIKCDRKLVRTLLFSYGFLQCSHKNPNVNLIWTNTHLQQHSMRALRSWQRINHFPRSHCITKKDALYTNIARAKAMFSTPFDFIPHFFITPEDIDRVRDALIKIEADLQKLPPLIVKPAGSSNGRGIIIINSQEKVNEIDLNARMLVSTYIPNPLLLNELKFDLRIYVCVTSFYPLVCYVYRDGLARFATQKYDVPAENFDEFRHLTNYSLNKSSNEFIKNMDPSEENIGHKWSLSALLRELEQRNIDTRLLMVRIEDIVIKTLLSAQYKIVPVCRSAMLNPRCCFELFGFDILISDDLKPWLLEVNLSPSLGCDAPLDTLLKTRLLADTLNLAAIPLVRQDNILNTCSPIIEQESQSTENGNIHMENLSALYVNPNRSDTLSSTSSGYASGGTSTSSFNGARAYGGITRRHRMNSRVTKVKKATLFARPSFIYEKQNSQYKSMLKFYGEKINTETDRRGGFVRVFPRTTTWPIYSGMMEDIGPEKWDKALYMNLYGSAPYYSYPKQEDLSNIVREIISEALDEAIIYREKMPTITPKPFPVLLPRVRSPARKRTQSCMESEEMRKIRLEEIRSSQEVNMGSHVVQNNHTEFIQFKNDDKEMKESHIVS